VAEGEAPGLLEWVADGGDGVALGEAEERSGDGREEVGVFVGVEVGDADAGSLEVLDLGEGFALDVVFADDAAEERLDKVEERGAEVFAVGAEESGDGLGRRDGGAVGEDDVAADAEGGVGAGDGDGVVERRAGGHEGGGGEGVGVMELRDGAIDASCEAEVVRIKDEAGSHEGSDAGREENGG
jgi:hypothetical protein